ncbi:aspartoacylase-like isoform X2 [Actinia tenebrosa]|nr:aspartoacylase-like isoform X2 [Actinia tenebrosa]
MAETKPERVKTFSNVSISGGTHGNEMTGIHLVRRWMSNATARTEVERSSFKTHLLLSNPRAIEKCVRYIHVDLNRQFSHDPITPDKDKYEVQRACEIQKWIADNNVDYSIDLHNTTSNMGVTLILTSLAATTIGLQITASIKEAINFPVSILSLGFAFGKRDSGFTSLTKSGIGIEVGPLAHGTVKSEVFQRTAAVVSKTLDIIEAFNNGKEFQEREIELFECKKMVKYPCDENGNISAMIHPKLEEQDWKPLKKGDPMFMTFGGQTITYEEEEVIWPTFINEASYLEKEIAFAVTKKVKRHLGAVKRI